MADLGIADERGTVGFLALGTASFALLRVPVETPLGHLGTLDLVMSMCTVGQLGFNQHRDDS